MPLRHKQKRFIDEYLLDGNATQAAIRAGYAAASAGVAGYRLLKNAEISEALEARQLAISDSVEVSAADIAARAWAIANDEQAPHSARVSALTLLAKRHPEFSDTRKPAEQQHLHLHAGLDETRQLLSRIEAARTVDTQTGELPPHIIDAD